MAADRKPWLRPHDPTMDLPAGKTCGDCSHFTRCNLIFGHIAADEVCDWSPSMFRPEKRTATLPPSAGETSGEHGTGVKR